MIFRRCSWCISPCPSAFLTDVGYEYLTAIDVTLNDEGKNQPSPNHNKRTTWRNVGRNENDIVAKREIIVYM